MKRTKTIMLLRAVLLCVCSVASSVFSKNGAATGKIYSTDIIAKIDGLNAPSYNIGGKTAIIIEELADKNSNLTYAVNMKYDDANRRLDVTMNSSKGFYGEQYDEIKRGKGGSDAADSTVFGLPTVDSLGVKGEHIHSPNEFAYLDALKKCAKQAVAMILEIY